MTTTTLTVRQTEGVPLARPDAVAYIRTVLAKVPSGTLEAIVGGLSNPSKMPGYAYGIPAEACRTGSALRKVAGSACSKCYALKGSYVWSNTRAAYARRLACIRGGSLWVAAMSLILERLAAKGQTYFRWHDSGDIQDANHLRNICMVHRFAPTVQGWMPTREYRILDGYGVDIPQNLTVRVSAHMIGQRAPSRYAVSSMIIPKGTGAPQGVAHCPAPQQGGECGTCRNCWNRAVPVVAYTQH
jgi:hypothetical protein